MPAAPAANRPDLTMPPVGRHIARQSDEAAVRPIHAGPAIVLVGAGWARNDFQIGRPCETPRVCLKLRTPCVRRLRRACSIGGLQHARWPYCSNNSPKFHIAVPSYRPIDRDNHLQGRCHFVSGGSGYRGRNSIPGHEVLSLFAGAGGNVRPGARGAAGSTTCARLFGTICDSRCAERRKIGAADADTACGAEIGPAASVAACGGRAAQHGRGWSAA